MVDENLDLNVNVGRPPSLIQLRALDYTAILELVRLELI